MRRLWVPFVFLLGACGPRGPAALVVTGLEPRTVPAVVGQVVEWEVTFRDGAGALVEPARIEPLGSIRLPGSGSRDLLVEREVVEPGRHRLRVTPLTVKPLTVGLEVWACETCVATQHGSVTLEPDPPVDHVVSLAGAELTLVAGEARAVPTLAVGTTLGPNTSTQTFAFGAPLVLVSSDPSIARVEAGRVRGVAVGTATLSVRVSPVDAGVLALTLPVRVIAGDAGISPPEGLYRPFAARIDPNMGGNRHLQPPLYEQLKVDGRGRPVTVGVLFGAIEQKTTSWLPALVGQWTGSGFETLLVGRPGEAVRSPRLAIDERDRRYVLYRDRGGRSSPAMLLAEFDPDTAPDALRVRELPVRLEPRQFGDQRDVTTWLMGIAARRGGGAWVAWVHSEGELSSGPATCTLRLRLAEVTDEDVTLRDVAVTTIPNAQTCRTSDLFPSDADGEGTLVVEPTRRPGATPDLVVRGIPGVADGRLVELDGGWKNEPLFPEIPAPFRDRLEPWVLFPPIAPSRGSTPGWTWWNGFAADQGFLPWWQDGQLEYTPEHWPEPIVGGGEPFALQDGERTWLGNEHPGVLLRRRGNARYFFDDPMPRWFDGGTGGRLFSTERRQWFTQGVFSGDGRLHVTMSREDELAYGVVEPPRPATATDAESSGVLLQRGADPWLPTGLSLTSDGVRYVALRKQNAELSTLPIGAAHNPWNPVFLDDRRLDRSPAPGQPFERVTLPTGVWAFATVVAHGGSHWAVGAGSGGLQLLRSTDAGRTFSSVLAQPAAAPVRSVVAANGTVLFALGVPISGDAELWRIDVSAASPTATNVATAFSTPLPSVAQQATLVSSGDGVVVFAGASATSERAWRVSSSGALVELATLTVPASSVGLQRQTLFADGATFVGATDRAIVRRLAGQPGFVEVQPLPPDTMTWTTIVRPATGRLVLPTVRRTGNDCWRVASLVSTDDGAQWAPGPLARPQGGCLQLPWQALASAGEVLLAMSDNDSLRAFELGDDIRQEGTWTFPDHDALFIRLPGP